MKNTYINCLSFILLFERILRKTFTVMRGDYFKSITAGSVNECERARGEEKYRDKGKKKKGG